MRKVSLTFALVLALRADDRSPIVRSWMVNPAARSTTNSALRAVLPEVQGVHSDQRYVYVESAGLSLVPLGALDANDREPPAGPRKFVFRFPLAPTAARGGCAPVGVAGAFLNGVPIYSPISATSYRDQNLWHLDAVAALSKNSRAASPLLASLFSSSGRHSQIIGFALDGYPIYGPYGWDSDGHVKRLRSGYRLRSITRRSILPDGTELTPSQEGPPVDSAYPPGTFAEDYEYVPGTGDLDEHNGRFSRTPEYPEGTYAYFLSTYPYLVGPTYFGNVEPQQLTGPISHHAPLDSSRQIDLTTPGQLQSGQPADLTFSILDDHGRRVRFLEKVHERPIHLLVVSTDLAEFAHIHPELQGDDTYTVSYSFPHGGTYWLYADYTRPGMPQSISLFRVEVKGAVRAGERLLPDTCLTKVQGDLQVKLTLPMELRAGKDLTFRFDVSANDLEPYLGAWAHIMIVSEDRQEFVHAHPLDAVGLHTHAAPGPSPTTVSTVTGFRKPGLYRLWVQFQRSGQVISFPFTFRVAAEEQTHVRAQIPPGAVRVVVNSSGFTPARIHVEGGKSVSLAFFRQDAQNCAQSVLFPELGIRRALPVGEAVIVEIPSSRPREVFFTCGMGMFRGSLVIQ